MTQNEKWEHIEQMAKDSGVSDDEVFQAIVDALSVDDDREISEEEMYAVIDCSIVVGDLRPDVYERIEDFIAADLDN